MSLITTRGSLTCATPDFIPHTPSYGFAGIGLQNGTQSFVCQDLLADDPQQELAVEVRDTQQFTDVSAFSLPFFQKMTSLAQWTWSIASSISNPLMDLFKRRKDTQQDCPTTLTAGALATLLSGHPLPAVIAAATCWQTVQAQRGQSSDLRQEVMQGIDQVRSEVGLRPLYIPPPGTTQANLELAPNENSRLKAKVTFELFSCLPQYIQNHWDKIDRTNWIGYMFKGLGSCFSDYTQLSAPVKNLEKQLKEMNLIYWGDIVLPKYKQIFAEPPGNWYNKPGDAGEKQIEFMQEKLRRYGYHVGYGTPVQFIDLLIARGVCEGGWCAD